MQTNEISNLIDIFKSVRIPVEELSSSGTATRNDLVCYNRANMQTLINNFEIKRGIKKGIDNKFSKSLGFLV